MANDEVSDLIELALNQAITALEDYEEGDMLVEWVTVAFVTNSDKEKGDSYPMLYSNGHIPTYRARGLLSTALNNLMLEGI